MNKHTSFRESSEKSFILWSTRPKDTTREKTKSNKQLDCCGQSALSGFCSVAKYRSSRWTCKHEKAKITVIEPGTDRMPSRKAWINKIHSAQELL